MSSPVYVPYHELGDRANIIVDGSANASTVLTLSHWPGNRTPQHLRADSSAQIVFNYLQSPQDHIEVEAASNNHFDEDGLVGLYALLNPEEALEDMDLLIDVASAGDFGVYRDRDAARISFLLTAWTQPEHSPLRQWVFDRPYSETAQILYEELLWRLPKILHKIDSLEKYWLREDRRLEASEADLRTGAVTIAENNEIGLATISIAPKQPPSAKAEPEPLSTLVHPMAIHNATSCPRILLKQGQRLQYYDRYETWVQYTSRQLVPRVDLSPLAAQLTKMEKDGVIWKYDGVNDIIPKLSMLGGNTSSIAADVIEDTLHDFLRSKNESEH